MKATGIVRRIDELGRVVIPKEIRRTLHFREGDPLEIYTDKEGGVILKKYSVMSDIENCAREYADSLHRSLGLTAIITDKDNIVAVSGAAGSTLEDAVKSSPFPDRAKRNLPASNSRKNFRINLNGGGV